MNERRDSLERVEQKVGMELPRQRDEPLLRDLRTEAFAVDGRVHSAAPGLCGGDDAGERHPRQDVLAKGLRQIRSNPGLHRGSAIDARRIQ